ncbi:MAG: Dihydropteroate synthase [Bacteroidota bacterium]|jgi:dihydropteroate synthase
MGILNVTPDSFSDGGRYNSIDGALKQAEKMWNEGADIIDVGGYSSRPGADDVSEQEESDRTLPIIEKLVNAFNPVISIDTFRSKVAKEAVKSGAAIVNDISAGDDDVDMIPTVAKLKVPYIAMHKKGTPRTMQQLPNYDDVVVEVFNYLLEKKRQCLLAGIVDFVIDPGFGFGKTREHNFELLKHFSQFKLLESPILAGVSRKSMIWKTLDVKPVEAVNGTTFLHAFALQGGADILRVHDVEKAVQCVKLWEQLK